MQLSYKSLTFLQGFYYLCYNQIIKTMQDTNEIWKPIKGYEGIYEVSSFGRIKRILATQQTHSGKILSPAKTAGYLSVGLSFSKVTSIRIHRIVAIAFIPNPGNKKFVNHKNGVKHDNRVENLEWVTPKENTAHAWINKLNRAPNIGKFGDKHGRSKRVLATNLLSGEHVEVVGVLELCRRLNIGKSSVGNYTAGKTRHVNYWVFKLL